MTISDELRNELHDRLLQERVTLEQEIAQLSGGPSRSDNFSEDETDSVDQHPADEGSELFEREKNLTVKRTAEISLQAVNDALQKVADGTYGTCARCGKPVGEKRLRAMPEAIHCIDCQSWIERESRTMSR